MALKSPQITDLQFQDFIHYTNHASKLIAPDILMRSPI